MYNYGEWLSEKIQTFKFFREKLLIKARNQNIFEKFQLNRNLKRIPFKMMRNMSMLRHRFSNERGGGGALNHLPL